LNYKEPISYVSDSSSVQDIDDSIDFHKLLTISRRSIVFILVFFALGIFIPYLYIRYTKPTYQSSAVIKLNFKNEATNLGLVSNSGIQQDLNDISGEIELIKSKLFLGRVANVLNYNVSVFVYGTYLTDERFKNSPIDIEYTIKNVAYYNYPFDIQLDNDSNFELTYSKNGKIFEEKYQFGELISNDDFEFKIKKTEYFNSGMFAKYFFVFNSQDAIINYLEQNIEVNPENFNAKTIKISYQDFNRYKARDFVNSISELYLKYTTETKNIALEQKLDFLKNYIRDTEASIKEYETYFENFTIENKTINLENDLSKIIVKLDQLDSQKYNLQIHIDNISKMLFNLLRDDDLIINPITSSTLPSYILTAIEKYQQLKVQKKQKLSAYNENTLTVTRIATELGQNRKDLIELVTLYKSGMEARMLDLENRKMALESNFIELPAMGTEYNKIKQQYSLQEKFLMSLLESKMEMEITKAGTVTDSIILSPASLPVTPIKPQKLLVFGIGIITALLLSILFIGFRYIVNNKITSLRELEKLIDIPVIGTIPFYDKEKLDLTRLVIDKHSKSEISEALRTMRTNMEFIKPAKETKLISITSTISGEGKTFIAVNLGAIISATGQRVCIVDLDMRKPKVHLAFGDESPAKGMSTFLIGKSTLEECILETTVENLFYMGAGPTPPNPSELIMGMKFNQFLAEIKSMFDLIIIDTPPVGLVTDGVLAMKQSDIQLYVIRAEYSNRNFTKTIKDLRKMNQLSQLSIILNGAKSSRYGYGYGYGYGYYDDNKKSKSKFFGVFN